MLKVTISFPDDTAEEQVQAHKGAAKVLDAAREAGAVLGQMEPTEMPGFIYSETYKDGKVVR